MNELMSGTAGTALGAMSKLQASQAEPQRAFDAMRSDINIAAEAASATLGSLKQLGERLGIPNMYGCATLGEVSPPSSGEIEATQRDMNALIELNREIRGLAETIDARL